jgi:hypothetical protein
MQLGKMHLVKEFFWFLFPTKELAAGFSSPSRAEWWCNAKLLSESFNCNVFVVEPNTCVVLLEVDNGYFKLLDSNGNIGWIWCRCLAFSKHFELVKE